MSLSVQHLQEPVLLFGGGHPAPDPKTGISLFGPYSESTNQITVAVIGDATTVDQVGRLLAMCASKVSGPTKYPLWTQDFPGFRKDGPFSSEFVTKTEWLRTLRTQDLDDLDRVQGLPNRIGRAVDLVCAEISKLKRTRGIARRLHLRAPETNDGSLPPIGGRSSRWQGSKISRRPGAG